MSTVFVHLRVHSEYSMRDGIVRIDDYVKQVKTLQMPAAAITDHVNLFALVKFYRAALAEGIKPIIGADILLQHEEEVSQCTLLCKNQQGYQHLTVLLSRAYTEGQATQQPLIQWSWLAERAAGLIILSGGVFGDVGKALLQGNVNLAGQHVARWQQYFSNHYYLELCRTARFDEEAYISVVLPFSKKNNIPVVATNDVRFLQPEDFEAHEARVCIHDGYVLDDDKRPRRYSEQQYLKSSEEMQLLFSDVPAALQNSVEIARRCSMPLSLGEVFLPKFPIPAGANLADYFKLQAHQGLQMRLKKSINPDMAQYEARLQRELDVIIKMGFPGYFLIVADFIAWAKRQNIPVGPGRGSGAGSLVAFSLGITELDPLQHDLLFERFLNPERVSLPDFDIDFCMEGRDRVIEYVADRYGHKAVAQIITYGTMAAKAVVRDVGRVLGLPYGFVDKIAKLIPFELGMTLEKALAQEDVLRERYESEEEVATLIHLAKKLEGITRNAGKHAGGVVIAPTELTDFVPLYCESSGEHVVTQFDKDDVESVGLVKFDFLGLRTLTIINWALQTINQQRAQQSLPSIVIDEIPLEDAKTLALLKQCSTTAVFQLESRGMKELIRRLQPDRFDDITALVALFRPGPLQSGMVDDFIDRKHGRAKVQYSHPDLEPILRTTYGVILYQEQVMQIAQVLAGYTLGGADILRRAMGKKKPEEMAKQRQIFTEGAKKRGIDEHVAEFIFDLMEKFAGYGFNKSHSAAYALIAYQTAWLKAHFPAEFMAAVLSSDMDNTDKVVGFISECRELGITICPPKINAGDYYFTVNKGGEIIYGFGAIKGVGRVLIEHLSAVRRAEGPFISLFDFCRRLDARKLTRRALEPLIKSGAMDEWGIDRAVLFANIDKALKYANQAQRNQQRGQHDLFACDAREVATEGVDYDTASPWSDHERLQGEKKTLGLYVSGHPMAVCEKELAPLVQTTINRLHVLGTNTVVIAGIVLGVRVIQARSGKRMAIMTLEDCTGKIEVTLFSEVYLSVATQLEVDTIFLVKGSVAKDDYSGGIKIVADAVMSLAQTRVRMARQLKIVLNTSDKVDRLLEHLPSLLQKNHEGRCPIKIIYQTGAVGAELQLGNAWHIKPSETLLNELYQLCGRENVSLEY
ncbi:MAG: DNA polymerase III subunit alpha [Coxiella sp. RIFCSPHIGHO2_12_FULL_42_15]|nr:MAG: DNA polymerase III subunit alpha [Coxiella sp. RIFCSPHIGHO2_12_FULL_42_15]